MAEKISTEEMYKIIKKQNGEAFAKVLRANVLLDIPNLQHILEFAGRNIEDAMNLVMVLREIRYKVNKPVEPVKEEEIRDPIELLAEAGYDAFYVTNLRQQNSIQKYFEPNERLCTFRDDTRYKKNYIIHAVKKNIKNIKRGNPPIRDDEYGTSVISIQISKDGGFISIKNRYNHTVDNPDATFNNNPDNIIPGLTIALKHKFGVNFDTHEAMLPRNYRIVHGQLIRFNYESDNIYYDEKYYFEGSTMTKINPDYEIMLDKVILDTRTGKVRKVHESISDPIVDLDQVLNNEISGNKVKVEKDKATGETVINTIDENKNVKELARTKNGCITSLHLYKTTELDSRFMADNRELKELYAPKVKKIGDISFEQNRKLEKLYFPELEEIGKNFLRHNEVLTEFNVPKLKKMGKECFYRNRSVKYIHIPELEEIGELCFSSPNNELTEFNAPKLKKMECSFNNYTKLKKIYVPELEEMKDVFARTPALQECFAPKIKKMGRDCFSDVLVLKTLYAPELEEIAKDCFKKTKLIRNLRAPKIQITEDTPKCIERSLRLTNLKDGIRNILHLPKRGVDGQGFAGIPSSQRDE